MSLRRVLNARSRHLLECSSHLKQGRERLKEECQEAVLHLVTNPRQADPYVMMIAVCLM